MRKRIQIAHVLNDSLISSILENEIQNGRMTISDSLSYRLIETLRMLKRHQSDGQPLPGYTEIQNMAREAGISDNLSKTTIKKALDLIKRGVGNDKFSGYVNVIHYILTSRLYPRLQVPLNIASLHELMTNVVIPAVMLKQQFEKAPESGDVAPIASKMVRCQVSAAELFVALLEDPEATYASSHLQASIIKKTGHTLSYTVIQRVERTVEWMRLNFDVPINAANVMAELVIQYKEICRLISPSLDARFKDQACEALLVLIESYVKESATIQAQLYKSF